MSAARKRLVAAQAVFRKWFGPEYDLDALSAILAARAVLDMDGEPLWLLIVSGSGNAKTETVMSVADCPDVHIVSTISSEAALLSGTGKKDRSKEATGGLLVKIGAHGFVVIKDFTSILSQNANARAQVMSAFREIADGYWHRELGTDGGLTLEWRGRCGLIGAVTTAWDTAHAAIAAMGDRFVLLRTDSTAGRMSAGRQAIANTGKETQMREELSAAVAGIIANVGTEYAYPTAEEGEAILMAADLVTRSRTPVEKDYQGNVMFPHDPEMPTRFPKELVQLFRGAIAVGHTRNEALRLAIRCARDSVPPMRLLILDDLAAHPEGSSTSDVRRRIGMPRTTVDRELQALQMLRVVDVEEAGGYATQLGRDAVTWRYRLADGISPMAVRIDVLPAGPAPLALAPTVESDDDEPVPRVGNVEICTLCHKPNAFTDESRKLGLCARCDGRKSVKPTNKKGKSK